MMIAHMFLMVRLQRSDGNPQCIPNLGGRQE